MLTYQAPIHSHFQSHFSASQLPYYGQAPIQYFPASYYPYSYPKKPSHSTNTHEYMATDFADFVSQMAVQMWIGEVCFSFSSPITLTEVPEKFREYTRNTLKAIQLSNSVSFVALKYIERLRKSRATLQTPLKENPEYVLAVAIILAAKFLDDSTYTSKTGQSCCMEFEFLDSMKYSLHVTEKEYLEWLQNLIRLVSQQSNRSSRFASLRAKQNPIMGEKRLLEASMNSFANMEYMYSCYHYPPVIHWYPHPNTPKGSPTYSPSYYVPPMYGHAAYPFPGQEHNYSMHPACGYGYVL
ncbi:hypothetical protein K493DRAFT_320674 [Basidiobolus meristosporus CBS 931.73]|uniref:Cyclin N-terminal domain-containing protein n=1 Tax=Basidiobolus meristosporus CBS 931.73 TaxID=1314790 RepID=A0A1Y1X7P3_9FUNG|nr:hypothetical protein K493DRAFT_320674 [Basidiobolus meristosporus CBS 931.73]|eukprot:ORX81406.1 hypothetical protein K493DRAFT_320674 [Basidiobolus meristosporus CBS 931.73]